MTPSQGATFGPALSDLERPPTRPAAFRPRGRGATADRFLGSVETHLFVVVVASLLVVLSVPSVAPEDLGLAGLASALPLGVWVGFAALLAGFAVATRFRPTNGALGSYVVAVTALFHGLSLLAYEVPRLPWAWKHVGIVDYIQRHNGVDPSIESMGIYHNWPGFFGLNALITETGGLDSPLSYVEWAPVLFNLAFGGALYLICRSFTADRRWIWTALMVASAGNWLGQDYFAPQALAFLLYLVTVAVVLNSFSTGPAGTTLEIPANRSLMTGVVVTCLLAIVLTHQLTPIVAILALGGLALTRSTRLRWPALLVGGSLVLWLALFARPFAADYLPKLLSDLTDVSTRLDDGLVDHGVVDQSQRLVSLASRTAAAAVLALAGLGLLRSFRNSIRWRPAMVLIAAPALLVGASSYGDEVLFRAFFFALPILAFLAAGVWFSRAAEPGRTFGPVVSLTLVLFALFGLSLVAKHGNDIRTSFTAQEVAAADHLYTIAPPGSLVIQLSTSSPLRFKNYENVTELAVEFFSNQAKERVVADAAGRFALWADDSPHHPVYVLLTRSQEAAITRLGRMPVGAYQDVQQSLDRSAEYSVVYENDDATLYQLDEHR